MALLAPPDVGVRGRALLKTVRSPASGRIVVPRHRVIGSNGQLTGFADGLQTKGQQKRKASQVLGHPDKRKAAAFIHLSFSTFLISSRLGLFFSIHSAAFLISTSVAVRCGEKMSRTAAPIPHLGPK
jgi:hypothetical protein